MEAKYRLVTTWPEDSVQVRDRKTNTIIVDVTPHELVTMKRTFDQAREALKLALDYYRSKGTQKFNPYEMEQQLEKALAAMEAEPA